jgi:hypothetical protein
MTQFGVQQLCALPGCRGETTSDAGPYRDIGK